MKMWCVRTNDNLVLNGPNCHHFMKWQIFHFKPAKWNDLQIMG